MDILKEVSLFNGLKENELNELVSIMEEKNLKKGITIFEEGAVGGELYVIKKGKVEVRLKRGDLVLVLTELNERSFFGELSLVSDAERSATCVALTDTVFYTLNTKRFWDVAERYPRIGMVVLKNLAEEMAERIRDTNRNLETYFLINQAIIDNEQFRKLYITARKKV